ncbi:PREDICTED: uncharacterized protein LOC104590836 isoform X2 [Nelumbo nucifera]|uniref:Uncharacterized protein LOC104590836 isoform X2 n=1 Tax=Nelumbo nucifera TaxID=4432 RepID=A0A1U7ZAE0_NELNU|nr:PREDICTED: uncharacterized protein LOC104590836 isoform X2 [Nelumbo nucifera]
MKISNYVSLLVDPKSRSCLCGAALICVALLIGSAFTARNYKDVGFPSRCGKTFQLRLFELTEEKREGYVESYKATICWVIWEERNNRIFLEKSRTMEEKFSRWGAVDTQKNRPSHACKNQCQPYGSEALPKGILSTTADLEMRPLWGTPMKMANVKPSMNLLAISVGIKQKEVVNQMVKKFLSSNFVIMLFHYDGVVDEWRDLEWSDRAVHVSAINQTKWWFAKRFLHPDIVAGYDYIFVWDEDIGVENFHPGRYLSIIKDEGLEISQPALDPTKSEVHHQITVRGRKSKVHRRIYKLKGKGKRCDNNSTAPPCIGWVEMMAPVFSRAAWRCTWYMIQNDLIHAWGLDMQLGYCAQGDRTKNVGVVDSEYIVHLGLPTLGVVDENKVRRQSYTELEIFRSRWEKAVEGDKCWIDPYKKPAKQSSR